MSWYEYNEELHLKNERQIADIACKTVEEVQAVIKKEESVLI